MITAMTAQTYDAADVYARTPARLPRQRRRRRPAPVVPLPWNCDNCAEPNEGRRRRCRDCGTTRV